MLLQTLFLLPLSLSAFASLIAQRRSPSLADLALQKVLSEASPIFGYSTKNSSKYSTWMSKYPDSTKLVHMNLPGAHDPQTWNYSQATQDALKPITDLDGNPPFPAEVYRCQRKSFIDMLNSGIRVFDIRYAFDVTNSTLVYWHSQALVSQTASVEDTLFGFYAWLDAHLSETLLLSFQYEGSTTLHGTNNAAVQLALYDVLTSPAAKKYFLQSKDTFGTLGEARGKITLLKRFDLNQLPASYSDSLPGIHFSPSLWTDNSPDITLTYNTPQNLTAYIEDLYEPPGPLGSSAAYNIALKYNATVTHLERAASSEVDSLWWSFASSENDANVPIDTPQIMALGNGTLTPEGGVNQRLLEWFKTRKGSRVGIVMFDFFDEPGDLVETFLGLKGS